MCHLFTGFCGLLMAVGTPVVIACLAYFTKKSEAYNLDPQDRPGAFVPFLTQYMQIAQFLIGLAVGSIVLIVGSSALHAQGARLPWFYASPLLLLAGSVLYALLFMVWL